MEKTIAFLVCIVIVLPVPVKAARLPVLDSSKQKESAVRPAKMSSETRISFGVRALYINLLADTKGSQGVNSFVGSIYKIDAEQDYGSLNPYVQVEAPVGQIDLGFGIGYDAFDVATVDSGTGDGDIELRNWLIYLIAAWPNQTPFKPFGEIGLFASHNDFDPIPSWSAGGRREFVLKDENSIYFAGGCDVNIYQNWSLNVYARYTDFDIQGEYIFRGDDRPSTPFYFTLEHLAYGLGVQYRF